jgi:hypothetical protein
MKAGDVGVCVVEGVGEQHHHIAEADVFMGHRGAGKAL